MRVIVIEHKESFDENNLRDFIDAFIAEKRKGEDSTFSVRKFAINFRNSIFIQYFLNDFRLSDFTMMLSLILQIMGSVIK